MNKKTNGGTDMKLCPSSKTRGKTILLIFVFVLPFSTGCSVRHMAVNMVGDALVSGNSVYETDEDIELVGEALPFGLKLMESLLGESPEHSGLLLTSCKGFVLYSYAYVDYEAEVMEERDLDRARTMKKRAGKLYLRALDYGLRGLEKYYPGFENQLFLEPEKAVDWIRSDKKKRDLPFLYWSAAALGLGISVSRDDAVLLARLPEVESLINRGLELDETWDNGALHSFKIQLAAAKVGELDEELIRHHYERALELTKGRDAGLYVAFVEAVSIPTQNREEFIYLINKALEIDPDKYPQTRLVNQIAQRKARWLMDHTEELILE
ncbi:MAG: TRAP transporter TatT component family protein [Acidobacteriota bacterium]|jgi:predicted anti-sigma-YlaC factor YlaD